MSVSTLLEYSVSQQPRNLKEASQTSKPRTTDSSSVLGRSSTEVVDEACVAGVRRKECWLQVDLLQPECQHVAVDLFPGRAIIGVLQRIMDLGAEINTPLNAIQSLGCPLTLPISQQG